MNSDSRHEARIAALQKLFERYFSHEDIAQLNELEFDIDDLKEINENTFDEKLFNTILTGTIANYTKIDKIISKLAPQWPIEMINKVDLQILRLAIFEGFLSETTPIKVVVNEAVDLAKEFGGDPSGKFINGVLGALIDNEKLLSELHDKKD